MKTLTHRLSRGVGAAVLLLSLAAPAFAGDGWKTDSTWHDGLAEKATYAASRVIYNKPRAYEAVIFTNKEQHDTQTLTKADKSTSTVEVWKHNHVEVIPTPNYDYKFQATSHLTVDDEMALTRLDCSSQEFCGTSFKQYQANGEELTNRSWDYWAFSYFPEAGRKTATVRAPRREKVVAADSLPLWLRDYDFAGKPTVKFALLPSQKSNRHSPHEPVAAEVRFAGEDAALNSFKLDVHADGKPLGTYWMAKDRLHVMTKYASADGQQTYELKKVERVNYWTIVGE